MSNKTCSFKLLIVFWWVY